MQRRFYRVLGLLCAFYLLAACYTAERLIELPVELIGGTVDAGTRGLESGVEEAAYATGVSERPETLDVEDEEYWRDGDFLKAFKIQPSAKQSISDAFDLVRETRGTEKISRRDLLVALRTLDQNNNLVITALEAKTGVALLIKNIGEVLPPISLTNEGRTDDSGSSIPTNIRSGSR